MVSKLCVVVQKGGRLTQFIGVAAPLPVHKLAVPFAKNSIPPSSGADSEKANARLIGIEYIISRRLFEGLPEEEKRFWHSHSHEVRRCGSTVDAAGSQ